MTAMPRPAAIYSSLTPISFDDAVAFAPTIGALVPHESRSAKFQHLATSDLFAGLESSGFRLHEIRKARVRDVTRRGFERHAMTFRHVSTEASISTEALTITIGNAHDGTSALWGRLGLYRFICLNGLRSGVDYAELKVKHIGANGIQRVRDGMLTMLGQSARIGGDVETMKLTRMNSDDMEEFATQALALRFDPEAERQAPISPLKLLEARRAADTSTDVWTVYNRVQENIVRGGISGHVVGSNGRVRRATLRAVNGIDQNESINSALWDAAMGFTRRAVPRPATPLAYAA